MEKVEELFKKFVYTGVGLISLTKDKVQEAVEKMISEEKISTKEGEKIVKEFLKNTETKKEELESQFKQITHKVVDSLSFAKKSEMEELEKRIAKLEKLLEKKDK